MFLLGISENKATRKEFAIYQSNVVVPNGAGFFPPKTKSLRGQKKPVSLEQHC